MQRAVIFDMDGVLVDSYRAHYESWRALAREHGLPMTEQEFRATFGQTSRDIVRRFWGAGLDDSRVASLDDRKEQLYREIVSRDFPAMTGAVELIDELADAGVLLAVGSSGPPVNVALALERLGRSACFAATVDGLEVTRGKPDPEVFQKAASKLGVDPARCAVIEDAAHGIEAAHAAGMLAVALVSTGRSAEELRVAGPDLLVHDLRELSAAGLIERIDRAASPPPGG